MIGGLRKLVAQVGLAAVSGLVLVPATPAAGQPGGGAAPARPAPAEATQFDFLVGQWELVVRPKQTSLAARLHGSPKLIGNWKAWRALDGWGIEDELRIVDGSGNPMSLAHSVRAFDPTAKRWTQSTLDVFRSRFSVASAEWRNGQLEIAGRGTDPEGRPYLTRTRFFEITANGFRWQQDRSVDDGKTWDEGVLRIEAKRVAAAAPR
jgi:hypothetical protein